jgi:CBS domain containing-hemolysin-like protein
LTAVLVLVLLTIFQVVLGELLPKAIALRYPDKIALALTYPMLLSLFAFNWSIRLLNGTGNAVLRLLGLSAGGHRHVHSPEELEQMVSRDADAVTLEQGERRLMTRVFRFGDHIAESVMVPRMKVVSLSLGDSLEQSLSRMEAAGHTRFPVTDGDVDKVVGYVHLKDVTCALAGGSLGDLRPLLRPAVYAPASLTVDRLLERMRQERAHMMVLLDEFAGTAGIATMEDVLQEVVGEMQDEFGGRRRRVLEREDGSLLVSGNLLLDQLREETGRDFPEAPANTVGGLVLHLHGGPAEPGDVVELAGLRLKVEETQGKRITRVRVDGA